MKDVIGCDDEMVLGIFAGIFDESGKILLRRRKREDPNVPCFYEGEWELPGGTIEEENIWKASDERIIGEELTREVREETGLSIEVPFMPAMYPVVYVEKERKIMDVAFVIVIGTIKEKPTVEETAYVSPKELEELAEKSEGKRLVSGWGKRMCRMALMALCHSPNPLYREEAKRMLQEIHERLS